MTEEYSEPIEDKKEEVVKDTEKEVLLRDIFPLSDLQDLSTSVDILSKKLTEAQLTKDVTNPESLISRLVNSISDFSDNLSNSTAAWKKYGPDEKYINDKYTFNIDDKEYKVGNGKMSPKAGKGGVVTGKEADYFILAKESNMERTPLYSSGFYIVLRGPKLSELNTFYNYVNAHIGTQGNRLGSLYFLFSDLDIVKKTWSLLRSLIIDSNLNKWDKVGRLEKYISLNDLNHIMLRVGRLMHPDGYNYVSLCGAPISSTEESGVDNVCDYAENAIVDLNDFQLTDFSRIPDSLVPVICSSDIQEPEVLDKYREAINEKISTFTHSGYRFNLKVPTLAEYLSAGDVFNVKLVRAVSDIEDMEEINNFVRFNTTGIYSIWTNTIESLDKEGNVEFTINDTEKIEFVLSQIETKGSGRELAEKYRDFVQQSTVTHIGYAASTCPKCGKLASNSANGFTPFEPRMAFFTMSAMKLTQPS